MSILDLPLGENHTCGDATTIGDFFKNCMIRLWEDGESFSGKRPYGNSGWHEPIVAALIKAGVVKGELDEDGYANEFDWREVNRVIIEALSTL